jgi:DNA polymerase-3 subunit epsilon
MRQVILDTETTGLEPSQGHRIIEIGCVELHNRRKTDRTFHQYLNPDRDIDEGAADVHGIRRADLADKPRFKEIASEFVAFVRGSEVIIHNAPFDVEFINRELQLLGGEWGKLQDHCTIMDTLQLARTMHPGQKNSLDALCARYQVDNSAREWHGALLDAQILADVYLAMTGGQVSLGLDSGPMGATDKAYEHRPVEKRGGLLVIEPSAEEEAAHQARLRAIDEISGGKCLWLHPGAGAEVRDER